MIPSRYIFCIFKIKTGLTQNPLFGFLRSGVQVILIFIFKTQIQHTLLMFSFNHDRIAINNNLCLDTNVLIYHIFSLMLHCRSNDNLWQLQFNLYITDAVIK